MTDTTDEEEKKDLGSGDSHTRFAQIIERSKMRDNVFLSRNYATNIKLFEAYFPPNLEFIERQRVAFIEFRANQDILEKQHREKIARMLMSLPTDDIGSYFSSGNFDRDNGIRQLPEYGWQSRNPIRYDEMQLVRDLFAGDRQTGYVILLTVGDKVKLEWMPVYKDGFDYPWLVACWKIDSGFSVYIVTLMEMLIVNYDIADDIMDVSESGATGWIQANVDTTLAIVNKFLIKKDHVALLHPTLSQERSIYLERLAQSEEIDPYSFENTPVR